MKSRKENTTHEPVPRSEHNKVLARLEKLEKELELILPVLKQQASISGKSLRPHRDTKKYGDN